MNEVLPCALARSLSCPRAVLSAALLAGCTPSTPTTRSRAPRPRASARPTCALRWSRRARHPSPSRSRASSARSRPRLHRTARGHRAADDRVEEGSRRPGRVRATASQYRALRLQRDHRREARSAGLQRGPASAADLAATAGSASSLGCAKPGSRFVVARARRGRRQQPGAGLRHRRARNVSPTAAWGEPQEPVDGMPDRRAR